MALLRLNVYSIQVIIWRGYMSQLFKENKNINHESWTTLSITEVNKLLNITFISAFKLYNI